MCAPAFPISDLAKAALLGLVIVISFALSARCDDTEPRERVILMTTGRVLTGMATRNAGGWLVEQSNGRVQVPIDQVSVVANSLAEAYRKQRDSVVKPTPATHVALAQWCIAYRLHDEARDELRQCLKLDPDHSAARKLLRRLDDSVDPAEAAAPPASTMARRSADGFLVPDAESLGGLSNEAAVTFTQRIQPLLMNKCGNASCHGTTATSTRTPEGFHLIAVRNGSNAHRLYTERNLAEVLRYVDLKEPSLSPIITLPQGTHGGTAGVFHGATGNTQLKMLRAWIKTVAEEKRIAEEERSVRPGLLARTRQPAGTAQDAAPASADKSPNPAPAITTVSGVTPVASPDVGRVPRLIPHNPSAKPLDEVDGEEPPSDDPFDPEIFNRRFHAPSKR